MVSRPRMMGIGWNTATQLVTGRTSFYTSAVFVNHTNHITHNFPGNLKPKRGLSLI